ncbi:MAG: LlaJI family restriction endonuclease, partial [Duncaniella sp.]|nr:LlaJI family restriction endonuclease [Duncaniella sp.]
YVGYCFNPVINDCVFFLPKVVLAKDKDDINDDTGRGSVFDRYNPVDLLDFTKSDIDDADRRFLQKFAIWIYRTVNTFYKNNDTSLVSRDAYVSADGSNRKKDGTLIDSILSLIQFACDNRDFVMFEIKNIHRGYNRVNWRKTISHCRPVRQGKTPVYLNPVNKKKQIDFDEELFVIFFSILQYVHRHYGFPVEINFNYDTIGANEFRHYLNGYGKTRLRQIKYKYFSDKALKLWHLCYSFFDNAEHISSARNGEDFLIAKDFNLVFESIIETLLGEELPSGFKSQKDGKIIDHTYPYNGLINADEPIYHIADSKYYKVGSPISRESVYKQYTYAKNVIQLTFDILFGKGDAEYKRKRGYLPYRDPLTEGYNITPNFFISAKIERADTDERYTYASNNLQPHDLDEDGNPVMRHVSKQFENRLFDRDTLILSHYDINFLYLIALY